MPNGSPLQRASRIGPQPSQLESFAQRADAARQDRALDESPSVFDSTWTRAKRGLTAFGESIVDPGNWDRGAALPLEAITMVTKKPLTELLRRLAPVDAVGKMLDPQEYPRITDAVQETVERFPRVMSHAHSVMADLPTQGTTLGTIDVPNRLIKWAQSQGAGAGDYYKRAIGDPVARIRVNPRVETISPTKAIETVGHEANHLAGFIADPRTYFDTGAAVQGKFSNDLLRRGNSLDHARGMAYHFDPSEISSRITGQRQAAAKATGTAPSMRDAYAGAIAHPDIIDPSKVPDLDTMRELWSVVRSSLRGR